MPHPNKARYKSKISYPRQLGTSVIELANETDVQIWCDFQEETKQTSADFFLRLRFANFRTFVDDINFQNDLANLNDIFSNDCGDGYGYGDGDGWGYGYGYNGHGYGNTHGDGWGYGDGNINGDG